jgi:prolyl-tRNA synthetase
LDKPEDVETPRVTTIESLAELLEVDPAATSKAMPVMVGDRPVLALIRGDDRLGEEKLVTALGEAYRPATEEEIKTTYGAGGGSLGPVGVEIEIVADETLREGQYVAGANRDGWHLRGVQAGRDYNPRFADIRQANAGDACPECGGKLIEQTAIELGHIFKLVLLRPVRRDLPRRGRRGETARDGQLRDRTCAHDGGDRRAAPRRAGHRMAGVGRPV